MKRRTFILFVIAYLPLIILFSLFDAFYIGMRTVEHYLVINAFEYGIFVMGVWLGTKLDDLERKQTGKGL